MVCLLAFASIALQAGDDPARTYAVSDKTAYLMLPPVTVCGPGASSTSWFRDGKHLIVDRINLGMTPALIAKIAAASPKPPDVMPTMSRELYSWSAVTNKTRLIFALDMKEGDLENVSPVGGTSDVFATVSSRDGSKTEFIEVSAETGQVKQLVTVPSSRFMQVAVSDAKARIAVMLSPPKPGNPAELEVFEGGQLVGPFALSHQVADLKWSKDGSALYGLVFDSHTAQFHRINAASGAVGDPMSADESGPVPDLAIAFSRDTVQRGKDDTATASSVWLVPTKKGTDGQSGLVSSDSNKADLAPTEDAVAFTSQGITMVRQIVQVPKDVYLAAKMAAERTAALSKAKQAGLALIMCASDFDDNLPGSDGWQDKIKPYLGDPSLLDGFNYTFGGGPMGGIDNPAGTMLGFVSGPGGRAVVYADGHAKWVPDP